MNVLETEWWTLAVPPEWWAEADEDTILVGDRDDVGCIEISTLHKQEGVFSSEEIAQIANDEAELAVSWKQLSLGDFAGVCGAYTEGEDAVREWYVASGSMLLFITYSCALENAQMDDAAVDQLLDTLMLVEAE
ncbi:MAG: hypothetical protein AB8C02_03335 [Halioglobus sp.]